MLNHTHAFSFFLGDLTSLEALIIFASWARLNIHKSLLNINNFHDGLIVNHVTKNHLINLLNVNNFHDSLIVNHTIKNHFILFSLKIPLYSRGRHSSVRFGSDRN